MARISFGMIVFNAATILPPGMLEACIKNVYPHAHEILIAEGAVKPTARNPGDATWASSDGRSTDDTVEIIKSIPDIDNKIKLVQKDGFWNGKLEMCNAYIERMTGDYIWQLDSDEFYRDEDMKRMSEYLSRVKPDRVDFNAKFFWGDFDHMVQGGKWANVIPWRRVFRHEPGDRWISHAPPVYGSAQRYNVLTREMTRMMGIELYHYAYVARSQVEFKNRYYANSGWDYVGIWDKWQRDHNIPIIGGDATTRFQGQHPKIIQGLIDERT